MTEYDSIMKVKCFEIWVESPSLKNSRVIGITYSSQRISNVLIISVIFSVVSTENDSLFTRPIYEIIGLLVDRNIYKEEIIPSFSSKGWAKMNGPPPNFLIHIIVLISQFWHFRSDNLVLKFYNSNSKLDIVLKTSNLAMKQILVAPDIDTIK